MQCSKLHNPQDSTAAHIKLESQRENRENWRPTPSHLNHYDQRNWTTAMGVRKKISDAAKTEMMGSKTPLESNTILIYMYLILDRSITIKIIHLPFISHNPMMQFKWPKECSADAKMSSYTTQYQKSPRKAVKIEQNLHQWRQEECAKSNSRCSQANGKSSPLVEIVSDYYKTRGIT